MKTFSIEIGGAEREVRYTSANGVALFKRFRKPLVQLIREDVLGLDENGKAARTYDPEAQVAFLHLGLSHSIRRLEEAQVQTWIDELLAAGRDLEDVVAVAAKAAYYSGVVLGRRVDIDEENAKAEAEKEGGKAQAPTATPAPEVVTAAE